MKPSRLAQLLVMTVVLTFLVACGGMGDSTPRTGVPFDPGDSEIALELVNLFRSEARECGGTVLPAAPALTTDSRLTAAAQVHSEYMAGTPPHFSHIWLDGTNPEKRVRDQGYIPRSLAENIAMGSLSSDRDAIEGWIASAGHCENLMHQSMRQMGIAMEVSDGGIRYWTQVLGAE